MTPWDAPTRRLAQAAGALSLVAGLFHLTAAPHHWEEWWGYRLFFVAAFLAQAANGLVLLWEAASRRARSARWAAAWRATLLAGILGNLAILALWAWTRLVAVPLGPEAGEPEALGLLDALTATAEAGLVVALAGLLGFRPRVEA